MITDRQPRTCAILLSGGIDSTVSLAIAKDLGWEIARVFYIDYGQKFLDRELRAVMDIMKHYSVPMENLFLGDIDLIPDNPRKIVDAFDDESVLYDDTVYEVKESCRKDIIPAHDYTYILPYRNAMFIMYAASILQQEDCSVDTIVIGTNGSVANPCNDESAAFLAKTEDLLDTCKEVGFRDLEVLSFDEVDWNGAGKGVEGVIRAGIKLKVPFELTTSCDNQFYYNCGICPTCVERLMRFSQMKFPDPAPYYTFESRCRLAPWLNQKSVLPLMVNKRTLPYTMMERVRSFLGVRA